MADVKISALPPDSTPTLDDLAIIVDSTNGETRRITLQDLLTLINDNLADASINQEKIKATVAFKAYRSTSFNFTTTVSKINLQSESFDVGSDYDNATNYRFNVPVTGYYYIQAKGYLTDPGDANRALVHIYKNGAAITASQVGVSGAATDPSVDVTNFVYLTAGDYIEIYIQVTTGTIAGIANEASTYLSGFLVAS